MTAPVALRGRVVVRNVYRDLPDACVWHPTRWDAARASDHVQRHTAHRLAYRIVARFK